MRSKRLTEQEAIEALMARLDAGQSEAEAVAPFLAWHSAGNRGGHNKLPPEAIRLAADFCRLELASGLLMPSGKLKRDKHRESRMLAYIQAHGCDVASIPAKSFDILLRAGVTTAKADPVIKTARQRAEDAAERARLAIEKVQGAIG